MTWDVTANKPAFSATYRCLTRKIALVQARRFEHAEWPSIAITTSGGIELTVAELEAQVMSDAGDDAGQSAATPKEQSAFAGN